MMARDRRYQKSRQARWRTLRVQAGIAAAVLAGAGAIGVVAVAATSHPAAPAARPAADTALFSNEGSMLSAAMSDWGWSRQSSYAELARLTWARDYSQTTHRGKTLDIQRGIVVLATHRFLILRSANGSLHLWLLSGATRFENVSSSAAGTSALTASTAATAQAMSLGNMLPATTLLAGSPTTAAAMLTPTTAPETVTVHVADTDLTVTVTITRSTATVVQTATTPATTRPVPEPSMFTESAWLAANSVARGDLAVVVGTRSHGTLHARLVLFSPLGASDVAAGTGIGPASTATPAAAPTHW
jgi:hypothetical protein